DFAPEHLSLICRDEGSWLPKISTSGAIYVGNFSVVAVGDFLAGPSHTLPTGGGARSFSGLRADQFQRRTSIVRMDRAAVAAALQHQPGLAFLDSAGHFAADSAGPLSIIAARPLRILRGQIGSLADRATLRSALRSEAPPATDLGIPAGGCCGWISYEGDFVF